MAIYNNRQKEEERTALLVYKNNNERILRFVSVLHKFYFFCEQKN